MQEPLGNAKWAQNAGCEGHHSIGGEGFFFGYPIDPSTGEYSHKTALCGWPPGHFLTVAPTRAGKGVSLIIPNLLCYRGSAIVIDPKGELAWITAPRRRDLGQRIRIIDPWGQVNQLYGSKVGVIEETARFNPLSVLKPGSDDFVDNLAYLADALIITESSRDPHWDNSARELVAGIMAYVVENPAFAPSASLVLVRKLLMRPNSELERMIRRAIEEFPDSIAALKLGQFENPEKTTGIASVISTARTQTAFLDSRELAKGIEVSDFSFDDFREGGRRTTVYLVIPPHKLGTYARWLRLMVSIAIGTVQKGPLNESEKAEMAIRDERDGPIIAPGLESDEEREFKKKQRELKQKQWDAQWAAIGNSIIPDLAKKAGGKTTALDLSHLNVPPGPVGKYRLEPLKKLPPELREPTLLQRAIRWFGSEARGKREARKREAYFKKLELKYGANWNKLVAPKPLIFGGIVFDPANMKPPTAKEMAAREIQWAKAKAKAEALERGEGLPVLLLLDEFGTIGKLAAVSTAFGLAAGVGAGITMWAFVQDLNQLKRFYPDEWETFVGNVKAMLCFGLMDQFTLEYVSKMLGTRTVRHKTTSKTTSTSTKIREKTMEDIVGQMFGEEPVLEEAAGSSTSENTAEHVVAQPLLSPDEIRKMHPQKCIVIRHGDPVLCWRVDYYSDKTFSAWTRPDPKYAK